MQEQRRSGERVAPKTPEALRDVILMPAPGSAPRARTGVKAAGLDADDRPRLRSHDLMHTSALLLIAEGAKVVLVSRQLGHANPRITLGVDAHLFDAAEHSERAREALEHSFGAVASG